MKSSKFSWRVWWLFTKHDAQRLFEKLTMKIVWALPGWIVYWAAIRLIAAATSGKNGHISPDSLNVMDALKMWEDR